MYVEIRNINRALAIRSVLRKAGFETMLILRKKSFVEEVSRTKYSVVKRIEVKQVKSLL